MDVGGRQVGVVTKNTSGQRATPEQWAAYRHPDGTVVFFVQATFYGTLAKLPQPVFVPAQLAALAADARFHLS